MGGWKSLPESGWAGWKSLPESGFPKAPLWCQQLTRGDCNNIADILVKVRGFGVKVRFWTPPFWNKKAQFYARSTGCMVWASGKTPNVNF